MARFRSVFFRAAQPRPGLSTLQGSSTRARGDLSSHRARGAANLEITAAATRARDEIERVRTLLGAWRKRAPDSSIGADPDWQKARRGDCGIDSTMAYSLEVWRHDVGSGGPTSPSFEDVSGQVSRCAPRLRRVTSHSRRSGSQPGRISSMALNTRWALTTARRLRCRGCRRRQIGRARGPSKRPTRGQHVADMRPRGRSGGRIGGRAVRQSLDLRKECQKNLVHHFHAPGNVWWGRLQYGREIASEQ